MHNKISASLLCLLTLAVQIYGIMKGHPIKTFEGYEFQVGIFCSRGRFLESGFIISRKFILSGAAELSKFKYNEIRIIPGKIILKFRKTPFSVNDIIFHENYDNKTKKHNLAIIKLAKELEFSSKLYAATLYQQDLPPDALVEVSGWGAKSLPAPDRPLTKFNVVEVKTIDLHTCRELYAEAHTKSIQFSHIDKTNICTGTKGGKGTCFGDAGGPVLYKRKVVGIIAGGWPCATGLPDVHTRIINYIPWILKICLSEK